MKVFICNFATQIKLLIYATIIKSIEKKTYKLKLPLRDC